MMIPKIVVEEADKMQTKYLYNGNALQSISPAESLFGYTYFAHMVPPFKPDSALILGYGGGTVAELMRKVWGACKITGVDIVAPDNKYTEYKIKVMDAKEFVWENTKDTFFSKNIPLFPKEKYDYICVDLWNGGDVPDIVFDVEFVVRLREMARKLVSVNVKGLDVPKLKPYYDYGFSFDRVVPVYGNSVTWWSVIEK